MPGAFLIQSAAQMQHIYKFLFSEGTSYQDLMPDKQLLEPNQTQNEDKNMGWAYCMHTEAKDLFLLYFEKDCPKATLSDTKPGANYEIQWFDTSEGKWVKTERVASDQEGKIKMPEFPFGSNISEKDWAVKLKWRINKVYCMRNLIPIIALIVFLTFVAGVIIYLSKRFSWYFGISHINRLYILFALGSVFMIGGLMAFTNSVSPSGRIIYMMASISMGFTLYLIMTVILVDLVHFLVKVKPVYYGMTALVLALIIAVAGIWHSYNLKTTSIEIPIKGITKEVRALHISDIHLGHFRGKRFIQKIVDATNRLDIDVVFLTGDLYDGKINLNKEVIAPFGHLEVPIYFVEGNHDGYSGSRRIKQELVETGVIVLENEVTDWGEFQIIGLDHMPADSQSVDMHARGQKRPCNPSFQVWILTKKNHPYYCIIILSGSNMPVNRVLIYCWQATLTVDNYSL